MIEIHKETLYHFTCTSCSRWWSVADYLPREGLTCPHCAITSPKKQLVAKNFKMKEERCQG